ncbi:hypothetical protein NC652_028911 [Populus alba x Populus x berolinensis]|nr:hypothetical protein NC652_028911 [Populus alba x Populus x berolinensis]
MGKIGGSSWLSAVKRAFWSPSKENDKRSSRRREDHEQEEEEKQNATNNITATTNAATAVAANNSTVSSEAADAQQRHALAVAMATTAAAQAAVATAQAAVEVVRLTRPPFFVKQHFAAIAIQTAFRGYLCWDGSSTADDWFHCNYHPKTLEEIQSMFQETKEVVALKREKALAYAFSQQIWRPGRDSYASEGEVEKNPRWLERRGTIKEWEGRGIAFRDQYHSRDPVKTVEMDTSRPYSYSSPNAQVFELHMEELRAKQDEISKRDVDSNISRWRTKRSGKTPISGSHLTFVFIPIFHSMTKKTWLASAKMEVGSGGGVCFC